MFNMNLFKEQMGMLFAQAFFFGIFVYFAYTALKDHITFY